MARYNPVHSGYSIINGSGSGSNADRIDVWVEYAVVSQDTSANASQVYVYFYTALKNGYSSETHSRSGLYSTFTVNGTSGNTVSNGSYDFRTTTPMLLASYGGYVYHNSDGTGYASVSGSFRTKSEYISGGSVSGTIYLPTIYREATLTSAPNFTDEENPTIRYSNPAGSGMSSLQACIASTYGETLVSYRNVNKTSSSYTFNLTEAERESLRAAAPDSNSLPVRFYLKYDLNGSNGVDYIDKTMSIVNANPTISATITEISDSSITELTGSTGKLIKYYSDVMVEVNATAVKGATLESQTITCGSKTLETNKGIFYDIESGTFVFAARDSRGNVATQTLTKNTLDYIKLTCNLEKDAFSAEGNLSFSVSGNYYNGSFGAVQNTLTLQYCYDDGSGGEFSDWITVNPQIINNNYYFSHTLTGLDYTKTYNIQVRAIDKITTAYPPEQAMMAKPIFDWGKDDFNFNVPVHIEGDLSLTGDIEIGGVSLKTLLGLGG